MEPDVLQHILDGREKPTNLPLALLKKITVKFSKEREIGHGGFATVYKGVLSNGNVAVKRIRNNHTIDERLFYREVDSLMAINHQNVVRFVGFCASTDQTAIKIEGSREHIYAEIRERLLCFEYISNGSLQKYITGLSLRTAKRQGNTSSIHPSSSSCSSAIYSRGNTNMLDCLVVAPRLFIHVDPNCCRTQGSFS